MAFKRKKRKGGYYNMQHAKLAAFLAAMSDEKAEIKKYSAKMVIDYRKNPDNHQWNKSLKSLSDTFGISERRLETFKIKGGQDNYE